MDFGITQEEINEEIQKIKEEQQFKERVNEILQSQIEKVTNSFGKRFQEFQVKISEEVSSKDKTIESLNLELTSLKETIEILNREKLDLKSKISSVNDLVLSTQKKKIDPSPHSEEFFRKIKFQVRNTLRRVYKELNPSPQFRTKENSIYHNNTTPEIAYKNQIIPEDDVKSPISKYIIRKINKYFQLMDFNFEWAMREEFEKSPHNHVIKTWFKLFSEIPIIKKHYTKEIDLVKNKRVEDEKYLDNKFGLLEHLQRDPFIGNNQQIYQERNKEYLKLQHERLKYFLTILP
jgi:hypothetical protein